MAYPIVNLFVPSFFTPSRTEGGGGGFPGPFVLRNFKRGSLYLFGPFLDYMIIVCPNGPFSTKNKIFILLGFSYNKMKMAQNRPK